MTLSDIIIASLFCIGLHVTTEEGLILHFVRRPFKKFSHYIRKPLFECPPCQASIWGSAYYLTFVALDFKVFLFIFCVAGLNAVLVKFFG